MSTDAQDNDVWKALADPTRRRILDLLRQQPRTTGDLCKHFEISRFGVMKHLGILEAAGLVTARRRGRSRINYLNAIPIREIYERWVSRFAEHWTLSMLSLKREIEQPDRLSGTCPLHSIDSPKLERLSAAPPHEQETPRMTTTTSTAASSGTMPAHVEVGANALGFARGITLMLLEDIPDDKLTHRPGAKGNHAAWIMGHIAVADDGFRKSLGAGQPVLPESWNELFGMGSQPKDDPAAYPSRDELRGGMERARNALLEWFRSLDNTQLAAPLPENLRPFAPDVVTLMSNLAVHESFHAGQLSAIRRSLDLPHRIG
jgi:DNA-binding transcriptional ArsR family regulator/uncharacterized damage-inducible protein DinB